MSKVAAFRGMHGAGRLLVLPNAWDALSARLVEESGAEAIATGSAAVAWAHGYPDGQKIPFTELVSAVRAIARVIRVPLTIDIERGYHEDPARVAEAVEQVVEAGAVGVNLEDGGASVELLAGKIHAVRRRLNDSVFINARTCIVLHGRVLPERAAEEVLGRAAVLADAGADGLFVPGLADAGALAAITRGTPLPLNAMLGPQSPALPELRALGVRRLSLGPRLAELAYATAQRAARNLLVRGDYGDLLDPALTYAAANALFAAR